VLSAFTVPAGEVVLVVGRTDRQLVVGTAQGLLLYVVELDELGVVGKGGSL
jgi:hypothetical protein